MMNNHHAANFLMEMGDNIKEIKEILLRPTATEEQNTELARRIAELETATGEAIEMLSDQNTAFPNRVYKALNRLERGLEGEIPF